MPVADIALSAGGQSRSAKLVYVATYPGSPGVLVFLHRVRRLRDVQWQRVETEAAYNKNLPAIATELADQLMIFKFQAIVCPPSTRTDAVPYADEIMTRTGVRDFSQHFRRTSAVRAGPSSSTAEDVYQSLAVNHIPNIDLIEAVVMVDESYSSGKTAAAVWSRLLEAGLSTEAQFIVAAPLWIG